MKNIKKPIALSLAIMLPLTLIGCGEEIEYGLNITTIAPAISYEMGEEYGATLTVGDENLPVLLTSEMIIPPKSNEQEVASDDYEVGIDDINNNAAEMMGSAGFMKITAQLTSGEIDVIICDYENGQRLSSMETFMPLENIFTPEELAEIDENLLVSYQEVDDENNTTGTMLPPAGIDVSNIQAISDFMVADQLVCHIVSNTPNMENAKEYMVSVIE